MDNIDLKIQLLIAACPDMDTSDMEWVAIMIETAYQMGRLDKQLEILEEL